jgi:MFS family permease
VISTTARRHSRGPFGPLEIKTREGLDYFFAAFLAGRLLAAFLAGRFFAAFLAGRFFAAFFAAGRFFAAFFAAGRFFAAFFAAGRFLAAFFAAGRFLAAFFAAGATFPPWDSTLNQFGTPRHHVGVLTSGTALISHELGHVPPSLTAVRRLIAVHGPYAKERPS